MKPLTFLVDSHGDRLADLAVAILKSGLEFGAQTNTLSGQDIRRWRNGRRIPRWAEAAIVSLAISHGWTPASESEMRLLVSGFRAGHGDGSFADLKATLPVDLSTSPELRAAWRADLAEFPK